MPLLTRKWPAFLWGSAAFAVGYLYTNHVHLHPPVQLALSAPDRVIPFLSQSIWIYDSHLVFILWAVWCLKSPEAVSRTLYAMAIASIAAFAVFYVFPTTMARGAAPVAGIIGASFRALYSIDTPANCFPSLHVALATIAAEGVLMDDRRRGVIAGVWAWLIVLSTITTRQHYFADTLAGVFLAGLSTLSAAWSMSLAGWKLTAPTPDAIQDIA